MVARISLGFVVAGAMTLLLLLLMQALIASSETPLDGASSLGSLDMVRVLPPDPSTQRTPPTKPVPPQVIPPPRHDPVTPVSVGPLGPSRTPMAPPGLAPRFVPDELLAPADRQLLLLSRALPQYPRVAEAQGIEGYVLVQFTVTTSGSVRDLVVIEAQPQGVFEQAALRAVERFKYQPQEMNGQPIAVQNVPAVVRFEL